MAFFKFLVTDCALYLVLLVIMCFPRRGTEEAGEANEKKLNAENVPAGEDAVDVNKEAQPDEAVEKEPEEKVNMFSTVLLFKAVEVQATAI